MPCTNRNHYNTAMAIIIFRGAGEINRGHALLKMANKPEKALYRAPTFSLLALHGGISSCYVNVFTSIHSV